MATPPRRSRRRFRHRCPGGKLFGADLAKNGGLSERPLDRRNALEMIYRRSKQAGIATQIGCHTFRATGITIYLTNGGTPAP